MEYLTYKNSVITIHLDLYIGEYIMITLQRINYSNIWKVTKLQVQDFQEDFVATNTQSILEAYAANADGITAIPFGIYSDDSLVGFVMFGYGKADDDDPEIAEGNYLLWRFMIDKTHQRKGFGKAALDVCISYLRTMPCGNAQYCWLSYEPENTAAKALYESVGFLETGEVSGGERVAVLKL